MKTPCKVQIKKPRSMSAWVDTRDPADTQQRYHHPCGIEILGAADGRRTRWFWSWPVAGLTDWQPLSERTEGPVEAKVQALVWGRRHLDKLYRATEILTRKEVCA